MNLTLEQQAADENTSCKQLRILAKKSIELARLVAGNSSTDSRLLRELAASNDLAIQAEIIVNPNTPCDLLVQLGAKFPQLFLWNPVLLLLILENPNLFSDIPGFTLLKALMNYFICLAAAEKVVQKLKSYLSSSRFFLFNWSNIDSMTIFAATDIEMKRLGWTIEQDKEYVSNIYGKRSRLLLTDDELIEYWMYLREL